ncbi:MAG: alpha/beta fold hydrolase [Flavobacteriaceae bacterium]
MTIAYKGISVSYSDAGTGAPLILLHGFLENKTMWQPFIPTLSKTHRVVCVDLLGHGNTECLGYIHTMEAMAEAVKAVITRLKIEKATFVGHSMGGYVALAFAEKNPEMVSSLCLMNSTCLPDTEEKKINRDRAIEAVKQNHKTFIRLSINNLFMPENRSLFTQDIEQVIAEAMKIPLQGIVAALEGMKIRQDRLHVFKNSSFNKTMIIGKNDPVLNYESLIEQAETAQAPYTLFNDGHMSHIENKQALLELISILP